MMKVLKGNANFKNGNYKASHGYLRELLFVFEYILIHFENLTKQVENGEFNGHPDIPHSINEV